MSQLPGAIFKDGHAVEIFLGMCFGISYWTVCAGHVFFPHSGSQDVKKGDGKHASYDCRLWDAHVSDVLSDVFGNDLFVGDLTKYNVGAVRWTRALLH